MRLTPIRDRVDERSQLVIGEFHLDLPRCEPTRGYAVASLNTSSRAGGAAGRTRRNPPSESRSSAAPPPGAHATRALPRPRAPTPRGAAGRHSPGGSAWLADERSELGRPGWLRAGDERKRPG